MSTKGYCCHCGKFTDLVYLCMCIPCFNAACQRIAERISKEPQDR